MGVLDPSPNPDTSTTRALPTTEPTARQAFGRIDRFLSTTDPYRWNDEVLLPLAARWHNRETAPFSGLFVGDSIAVGYFSTGTPRGRRWIDRTYDRLCMAAGTPSGQAGYINAASSVCAYGASAFTAVGGGSERADVGLGLGASSIDAGGTRSFTWYGDAVDVFYSLWTGVVGPLRVRVDGAIVQTITLGAQPAAQYGRKYRWTGPVGVHTLTLEPGGANAPIFEGAMFYNGNATKGVQCWLGGHFGYRTNNFTSVRTWEGALDTIDPAYVVVALQSNDQGAVTADTYETQISTLVANIRSAVPDPTKPPAIILAVPFGKGTSPSDAYDFQRATWRAALELGCAVLDHSRIGGHTGGTSDLYDISFDGVHPNDKGHAMMGAACADLILRGVRAGDRPIRDGLRKVTASTTASDRDSVLLVDATTGPVTVTLPTVASTYGRTDPLIVKKVDASGNAVTVDGNGAETVEFAATLALPAQGDTARLIPDGVGWVRI